MSDTAARIAQKESLTALRQMAGDLERAVGALTIASDPAAVQAVAALASAVHAGAAALLPALTPIAHEGTNPITTKPKKPR